MSDVIRVLLVDDAAFMRRSLAKLLKGEESVEIVGEASNGIEAIARCDELRPDVVCLDIDMPEMDGITAAKHIMSARPTPIIVVSSMTDRSDIPFEMLRLGAIDFFPKPSSVSGKIAEQTRHLLYLIRNARHVRRNRLRRVPIQPTNTSIELPLPCRHVIAIGGTLGSVGGLIQVLSRLPASSEKGLAVVFQNPIHAMIAQSFLESIQTFLGWRVVSAKQALELNAGMAVFMPPGMRATAEGKALVAVEDEDACPINGLFNWAGETYGKNCTVILLAGDREAGLEGLPLACERGARCFIQDERSALFESWMPEVSAQVSMLDLDGIIESVSNTISGPRSSS